MGFNSGFKGLNSKLEGSKSLANRSSCFTHEEEVIVNHCIGGAVDLKACLYVLEKKKFYSCWKSGHDFLFVHPVTQIV